MKVVRIAFSIALVGWTLFSLAGIVLSLLLGGPETAFMILWVAVVVMAAFVWASVEGGVWFYRWLFGRIVRKVYEQGGPDALQGHQGIRIDAPPPAGLQEQWRAEGIVPDSPPAPEPAVEATQHDDPWAHAPDYETGEDEPDRREDEFPTIKEQFPRL